MLGPELIARTISNPTRRDRLGNPWQYLSRSDHDSKVGCWTVMVDLLERCALLQRDVSEGAVGFGNHHTMIDLVHDRREDLDLVLCTKAAGTGADASAALDAITMVQGLGVALTDEERSTLDALPTLARAPVGFVLLALEVKALMTAHQRALPRLYEELNSSHATVHGASDQAIAAGLCMVNVATRYPSPDLNKRNRAREPEWSVHDEPRDASLAVAEVRLLPRRSRPGDVGYDAFAIVVVVTANDGGLVRLVEDDPAPPPGDIQSCALMIDRLSHLYATRFKDL